METPAGPLIAPGGEPCQTRTENSAPVDLDDTFRCPLGHRCESCGAERDDLAICTVELGPLGVACLTMCPRCAGSDVIPPVAVGTAVRLTMQHCLHLGIDADQMAAAMEADL